MTHPRTGETVLLQECKRICTLASGSLTDESTNQLALVRCLLELGANIDLANEMNGESPLGCAAWYGHLFLLDLLLEAGGDKDGFLRRCSFSPLHFAALGNNVACAKMLLGRSAIVNVAMPPTNAEMPLYFAIRSKSQEMVDLLLCSKADPCSFNALAETPIHVAIACGHLEILKYFGEILRGFDLLAEDENKQTPLHVAAADGDETTCRLLLTKMKSNTMKATAIDVADIHGRTALHLAVIHGHELAASMLVAAGASLDARCRDGLTALLYAAKCNRLSILISLFLEMKCNSGRTLLHYSAIHGDEETLDLLLKEIGQDSVNLRDKNGYTALLYAFTFGKLRVVRRLCDFGAD
eukprot:jgi/Phyca11/116912/e_gw1.31.10.1